MANNVFSNVSSLRPPRSVFDLSYNKKFTCDMGQLIPIFCDEVVPGDVLSPIGNEAIVRFQPLVAPILHEVNVFTHYFFVPYRLLWPDESTDNTDGWVNFIRGGTDGLLELTQPSWIDPVNTQIGSLWDYMGMPDLGPLPIPNDYPRKAYEFIFNEYYRDQDLQDEVVDNQAILNRAWEKDYFTAARPFVQKGQSPALPVSGTSVAQWDTSSFNTQSVAANIHVKTPLADSRLGTDNSDTTTNLRNFFGDNVVDLSTATTFDINDLRESVQIQKWLERNARAGTRYKEFINSHFGDRVAPSDERLQRPEYIGGTRAPVVVSETLQTSASAFESGPVATTPQGNMAGHGITVGTGIAGSYRVREFGLIMGIMSVMPRTAYEQGINRQWARQTRYDYYFPEFSHLSEQAILQKEIMAGGTQEVQNTPFGYIGRYDEMRVKMDMVCGQMRRGEPYDYWHLGRQFDPSAPPALNSDFIKCQPDKRIFAAPSEPGLIVNFGNRVRAIRPMPAVSNPGLMDHF